MKGVNTMDDLGILVCRRIHLEHALLATDKRPFLVGYRSAASSLYSIVETPTLASCFYLHTLPLAG